MCVRACVFVYGLCVDENMYIRRVGSYRGGYVPTRGSMVVVYVILWPKRNIAGNFQIDRHH